MTFAAPSVSSTLPVRGLTTDAPFVSEKRMAAAFRIFSPILPQAKINPIRDFYTGAARRIGWLVALGLAGALWSSAPGSAQEAEDTPAPISSTPSMPSTSSTTEEEATTEGETTAEAPRPGLRTLRMAPQALADVPMSATATAGMGDTLPDFFDPAGKNAAKEPKEIKNTGEEITITGTGGRKQTAKPKSTPDKPIYFPAKMGENRRADRTAEVSFTLEKMPRDFQVGDYSIVKVSKTGEIEGVVAKPLVNGKKYSLKPGAYILQLMRKDRKVLGRILQTTILTVEITLPMGDPLTRTDAPGYPNSSPQGDNDDNERVFEEKSEDPECSIPCEAATTELAEMLRWKIEGAPGGCPPPVWRWNDADGQAREGVQGEGLAATAVYTGLFSRNDHFGLRKVKLTMPGVEGMEDEKDEVSVEVFFLRDAFNHPGNEGRAAEDKTPNWFYYWATNNGGPMKHRSDGTPTTEDGIQVTWHYKHALDGSAGLTKTYGLGKSKADIYLSADCLFQGTNHNVTKGARVPNVSFIGSVGAPLTNSFDTTLTKRFWEQIDIVEYTRRHEVAHARINYNWRPGIWGGMKDTDSDLLPDAIEDAVATNYNEKRSFPNYPYTESDNDDGYWSDKEAMTGSINIGGSTDWAWPGKQSHCIQTR